MANRFWVGGTAAWNGTAGTKWATTSGGAGGAAVPTNADDVFFDAASGAAAVTITGTRDAKTLTLTGFTGSFAGTGLDGVDVGGSVTLGGVSIAGSTLLINITANATITSGGGHFGTLAVSAGTATLADALICDSALQVALTGTFDANDQSVTIATYSGASATATLIMGSGLWTVSSQWIVTAGIFTPETSTIKMTGTGGFIGGGKTYNNIWFTANNTITGANTFTDLRIDAGVTVTFTAGTTTTVTSLTWNGTPGSLVTVQSSSAGSAFTLSDASGGNTVVYASIKDSTATGGASFVAQESVNVSGNTGWFFTALGGGMMFFF